MLWLWFSPLAYACPFCHTATAAAVRAGLGATLGSPRATAGVLLPFVALSLILIVVKTVEEK